MKGNLIVTGCAFALAAAFSAAAATLPQPRTDHGITYLSGGIGHDEAAAMKAEAKHYPLSMVFSAGKHDAYLADVKVTMKDEAGKLVLDTVSGGPLLLVKVPAGKYRITAARNGKTLHRTVVLEAKGEKQVHFHWPKT